MSLMNQLTNVLSQQLAPQAAEKTGLNQDLAAKMLPLAMTALMGGLKKNASQPGGAEALASALDRHDGGLMNNAAGAADSAVMADGQKILSHILGGKQATTERALAKTAGVDQAQIGQLMAMAAPMVMAALGKQKREQGLDVSSLAQMVQSESAEAGRAAPNELNGLLGFLDQDGDGNFQDDLLEAAGKNLLGGLFGRR